MTKRFSQFRDRSDGTGDGRDFNTLTSALRRHSKVIRDPMTIRSWVKDYAYGEQGEIIADWRRPEPQA